MNKRIVIGIIIFALIAGGILAYRSKSSTDSKPIVLEKEEEIINKDLEPIGDDVKVVFDINNSNTEAVLNISGLKKAMVESLEYDISYESEGRLLGVGTAGSAIKVDKDEISRNIFFGTESSGKRKYDPNVENISLIIRFSTPDGPKLFKKEYL